MGAYAQPGTPGPGAGRAGRAAKLMSIVAAALGLLIVALVIDVSTTSWSGKVRGTPVAELPGGPITAPLSRIATPLSALLPSPARFPKPYDAVVLGPEELRGAAGDLVGVPVSASVDPVSCAPPAQKFGPDDTAIEVGTDDTTRVTITIALTRVDQPLTTRRDQIVRCPRVAVTEYGNVSTLRSSQQPPPSVDADDVLAVEQSVESRGAGTVRRRSMTTLMAQVGDVRVSATAMTPGAGPRDLIGGGPDPAAAALDRLFSDVVARVRNG